MAFGKLFISNPDLVGRLRMGRGVAGYRKETFYVGRKGYVDYPTWGGEGEGCENSDRA